jgi:hypothetical protein
VIATFHITRYDRVRDGMPAMYFDRSELRRTPGLRFWRLLGTGRGDSMTLGADLRRWAMFAVWEDEAALDAFDGPIRARWAAAREHVEYRLRPIRWHGSWDGAEPFDGPRAETDGPIAVLTRASVRLRALPAFYRAIPPVVGARFSVAIGEWPVARQATFSVWDSAEALAGYRRSHRELIRRTREGDWYSEELFARFAISAATR